MHTGSPFSPGGPAGPVSPLLPCTHRLDQIMKQLLKYVVIHEEARL